MSIGQFTTGTKWSPQQVTSSTATRFAFGVVIFLLTKSVVGQPDNYEGPPINYMATEVNDPVANLARRVEAGEITLEYDGDQGYLMSVLDALDVPVSSQTLVFSKTSLQRHRISPRRPRAVYFNDDVYVGYCQKGDVIELAATDAKQGAMFYTLAQNLEKKPEFIRDRGQCLTCHSSSRTQDVPGYLIRSVYASPSGMPEFGSGTYTTDHSSPFNKRWGGWYVTGTHGEMRHMGNAIYKESDGDLDRETHSNLESLDDIVSTEPYLSPHSDIVALMVMEHQTQMHNAIAWANYETRRAIHQSEVMNEALDRPQGFLSESAQRRINRAADRVLEYLLLCDEFPLTSPVAGTSEFVDDFESRGIRDSKGRSLRDFDLKTKLFQHSCSYLIYSDAFDGLPDEVRNRVYKKLHDILSNSAPDDDDPYKHLSVNKRRELMEILSETKSEFVTTVGN